MSHTPTPNGPNRTGPRPPAGLNWRLQVARLAVAWERVWPNIWPAASVVALFLAAAFVDLLPALGPWGHGLALLAFLGAFSWTLWRGARRIVLPTDEDARRRLERDSGLQHRPLSALDDQLASGAGDPGASALWQAHIDRLRATIRKLRVKPPRGSLAAVGVSVTSVSGKDITVTAGDEIDLSGASITQGSKDSLSIEAGGDITLDNAGVTVAQDSNSLRIVSTNGFVSARSADISGKGDVRIDGADGVDLAGAGLSGVKDNGALDVVSARGGVNLNGVVMLGDGDIVVDAEGNVFVVGANIASTKTDVVITSDSGMVSGREAAISAEDDVTITAAVRIYLPDSSIEDEDTPELNAPEKEV